MKKALWAESQFMEKIWDRWMKEYLSQLTTRKKANEEKLPMTAGDLVRVRNKQNHLFKNLTGRNLELHTGDEKVSRSVTIKTI